VTEVVSGHRACKQRSRAPSLVRAVERHSRRAKHTRPNNKGKFRRCCIVATVVTASVSQLLTTELRVHKTGWPSHGSFRSALCHLTGTAADPLLRLFLFVRELSGARRNCDCLLLLSILQLFLLMKLALYKPLHGDNYCDGLCLLVPSYFWTTQRMLVKTASVRSF
jgi:hypothetical protein